MLYNFNGGRGRGHTGSHANGVLRNRLGERLAHRLPQRGRPQDLDVGSVPEDVHHKLGLVFVGNAQDRRALGALHPSFMGGEYLPNRQETEVEIARINIDSTTSDVTSVYAKAGKNRIYYRVGDEYNGDTLSEKRTQTSKKPLTLGELVAFFLGAWHLNEVLEMNELDCEGAHDFTHPSSEFYPEFGRAIRTKINEWCPAEEPEESDDE